MTRAASPKLGAYAGLAALGLLAALATRRPELVALAAPFAVVATVGLAQVRRPEFAVRVRLDRDRALEGDELVAQVEVEARVGAEVVEILLELPRELRVLGGENPRALHLADGGRRELSLRLGCERWGAFRVGRVFLRTSDLFGLIRHETVVDARVPLK